MYVFDFVMRSLRGYFIDLAGARIDDMRAWLREASGEEHGVGADPVAARRLAKDEPSLQQTRVGGRITHA